MACIVAYEQEDYGPCSGDACWCEEISYGDPMDDDYDEVVLWACTAHKHLLPSGWLEKEKQKCSQGTSS